MTRSLLLMMVLTVGLGLATADANTLRGQRKGFMINLGGGGGLHHQSGRSNGGFAPNINLGWGVTDQVAVSWMAKGVIVRDHGVNTMSDFSGLVGTYYLRPQAPSYFLNLGMGSANLYTLSGKISQRSGWGIVAGAGSEFRKNWSLGVDGEWGRIGGVSILNLMMTISHNWY
jgi:hypothetical protein